ncbi:MAG: hypothetical protein KJ579_02345, partial [Verrucomicrobia bacterium]|nr:hypothetical protein [Verrucomicrobiota bacterium]
STVANMWKTFMGSGVAVGVVASALASAGAQVRAPAPPVQIFVDGTAPRLRWATGELRAALEKAGHAVSLRSAATLESAVRSEPAALRIAVAPDSAQSARIAKFLRVRPPTETGAQSYAIRRSTASGGSLLAVLGADATGAMYGMLDLAEAAGHGTLDSFADRDRAPHIERRGIRLNIPLDARTPGGTEPSDAAYANVLEMWSPDFWRAFLDAMARYRFNALALFHPDPFRSMVGLGGSEAAPLDDVWRAPLPSEDATGGDAEPEIVKRIPAAEKATFWRLVMDMADARGIEAYWLAPTGDIHPIGRRPGDDAAPGFAVDFAAHTGPVPDTMPAVPSQGRAGRRAWIVVRTDDISSFRWADPAYARGVLRSMPGPERCAGFLLGAEGAVWGRDVLQRPDAGPQPLTIVKHWLSFMLWGRLGYDPDLSDDVLLAEVRRRFPGADARPLLNAWVAASRVFPAITAFYQTPPGPEWFPETCSGHPNRTGFITVRHFMEGATRPGSGCADIRAWSAALRDGRAPGGRTPLEVASGLRKNADIVFDALPALHAAAAESQDAELARTLLDLLAMARLGQYYAAKIEGAAALAAFDRGAEPRTRARAIRHLEAARDAWAAYATATTQQYRQPVLDARAGLVDIPGLAARVAADIDIAISWRPGQLDALRPHP